MAARVSRSLSQVNRHVFAGPSFRAIPRIANTSARAGLLAHRNARSQAPWTCCVTQANVARYSHTDSASSSHPYASIPDATAYKGSSITEKHWMSRDMAVGTVLLVIALPFANEISGRFD